MINKIIALCIVIALAIGNIAVYTNAGVITSFLCGNSFTEDSEEAIAARESGKTLAAQVEAEGAVLLKNTNNALPLQTKKVNVFGWAGSDDGFIVMGSGSGTGSRNDLVTFLGGLKEVGIEYNETLAKAYDDLGWRIGQSGNLVTTFHGENYKKYYGVSEPDAGFYTDALINQAKEYSDTAIIVLGRLMGEDNDYSKVQYISSQAGGGTDTSRKLQSVSEREEYMINLVCENFENVILIVNVANPLELGIADKEGVDAAIHMGYAGTRGAIGIAKILSGEVNPSGRLADTWAYDLSTAATYATAGFEGVSYYTDHNGKYPYSEYRENIYNGYLWYETADAEGFWQSDLANELWGVKSYDEVVQYPFGYGLSYTTFSWELKEINFEDGDTIGKKDTIKATVRVTNTGSVAGKDVVEMYYSAPYTAGGIEKSAIKLGGYGKTPLIEPGQFADVVIEMDVETMKSYDCYDANNNGFMGYELEKGIYTLSFRTDVHTLKNGMTDNQVKLSVAEDIRYEVDTVTGVKVENQFTKYTNPTTGASSTVNEPLHPNAPSIDGSENEGGPIQYMTRANFLGTFPKEEGPNRAMGALYDTVHKATTGNETVDTRITEVPEFGSTKTNWQITDLFGVDYDDPMWDEITSQLTYTEALKFIGNAGFGTIALSSIGKPQTNDADGPSGFNNSVTGDGNLKAVNYPCSTILAQTWDWFMAYSVGKAIGIEGNALGIEGWYGPGANTHRSPMGGRNFEYYSEDSLLAGTTCAYHVMGAKEQGIQVYLKHIGTNEDDKGRVENTAIYKWLTEQAFRENYLKPFEIAVKVGHCNGLMASFTRNGGVRGSGSEAMLKSIVRDEWGFRGTVITDWYKTPNDVLDFDECIRGGTDQCLHPNGYDSGALNDTTSDTAKYYVFQAAKNMLYAYADTMYYAQTAQGLENGAIVGTVTESEGGVFAWWVPALAVINASGLTGATVLFFKKEYF